MPGGTLPCCNAVAVLLTIVATASDAAWAQAPLAPPPDKAAVIFYAQGSAWKGAARQMFTLGAARGGIYSIGHIFDGQDRLVLLVPKHYAVLALSPGTHVFSASQTRKHADTKEHLNLTLESGKTYFVRLSSVSGSLKLFDDKTQSYLEETPCQSFQTEIAENHLTEVAEKQVETRAASSLIVVQQPPQCNP